MAVSVDGPIRGLFMCTLPPGTAVHVTDNKDSILTQPFGKEMKQVRTSERGGRVFFQAFQPNGQNHTGDTITLSVNEREVVLPTKIDSGTIASLQEVHAELSSNKEATPEAIEEVKEMISEVEDKVCKTSKERMQRLIELKAMELRQVKGATKSDMGLLRRYKKTHEHGQKKQLLNQFENMNRDLVKEEDPEERKVCFITQQSSFQEAKDALEDSEEMLKMEDIPWERFFGLVGIPVSHTVQNYTDPMNLGISEHLKEVVASSECSVNQKSLWSLSGTKGTTVSLDNLCKLHGFKNKVTAVVPIKSWNDPAVWKAFHTGPLSKMVMSAQLRGAHIPMPHDEQAFTAATLLRTVMDWPTPNEGQASLMVDLLDTMQFTDPRSVGIPAQIKEFMGQTEMHIVNNMPSALAPVAKMLESKFVLSFAGTKESSEFWKAIVSNSIYWKVRRLVAGKNRDDILRKLANYKERTINIDELSVFREDLTIYSRIFEIAQKFQKQEKVDESLFKENQENIEEFQKFITNVDFDLFLLTEVVKAIICCGRVTKKLKCPELITEEKTWQWMEEEQEKREQRSSGEIESAEAWEEFLNAAPTQQLADFASSLNKIIPNEFEKVRMADGEKRFKVEEIFSQLKLSTAVEMKEKLRLILFGNVSGGPKWGNGEGLKNGLIAKQILEVLETLLSPDGYDKVDVKKRREMINKTNRYTKHWYRMKGSRREYTNDRPSFWAITKYSTPWAFMIKDREGYDSFKVDLQELAKEKEDMAKKNFYKDWEHLLQKDPTKDLPLATAKPPRIRRNQEDIDKEFSSRKDTVPGQDNYEAWENGIQMLSIFPHPSDTTFGLEHLMKTCEISPKDLGKEKIVDTAPTIASNWESILQHMLPRDKAEETIHSLNEVFRIDEILFKAFNAYQVLKRMPDLVERKADLIEVLKRAIEEENEHCVLDLDSQDRSSDIYIPDAQIKVFERSSIRILERLLPLRAPELKNAIEKLFGDDQVQMMSATYHVLERYMDYGLTSMDALMKLLMDEKLIHSTEDILVGSEQFDLVHPAVSFELKFEVEGKKNEASIKKGLQNTLTDFLSNENALLWMNQEYERSRANFNWKPLEVTKEDLKTVSISVDEAWYGGGTHEKVTVEFKYENYNSSSEIARRQKERLNQLRDFFQLILENVHQLVPITDEFVKSGGTWQSNRKPNGDNKNYETYEYKRMRQMFKFFKSSETARQETASIFRSLGEKGVKYNEAQKILDLLNSDDDVDNLTIRVQRAKQRTQVNQITCSPIFICPEEKSRLKELPEILLNKVNQLMKKELLTGALKDKYEEVFDSLINLNDPSLFVHDKREELAPKIALHKSTPLSMISIFLNHLRDEDRTIGELGEAFSALEKEFSDRKSLAKAMKEMKVGLDSIMKEAKQISESEAEKQFANDRSLGTFVNFLKDHHPNGMKKYAKARGFRKEQFLQLTEDKQLVVGDMICFWRKNLGIEYAHAGIYTPAIGKKYVVHVQAEGGRLRRMKGHAVVKYGKLEEITAKDDLVFFIRECQTPSAQGEVLSKVEACLFDEPIKYTYNGHYGSCQTFCSKVLGSSLFEELNPESFLTTQTGMKRVAGWWLGGEDNADELVTEMEKRFESMSIYDLQQEASLVKTCPSNSKLAEQSARRAATL